MRRLVAVVVGTILVPSAVAGAGTTGAGPSRSGGRTVTVAYEPNPAKRIAIDTGIVTGSPATSVASVEVMPKPGERALMVSSSDDSGYSVRIDVAQGRSTLGWFCGASEEPVEIRGGEPVTIEVFSGVCGGAAAVATRGTVKVTFLRRASGS